MLYYLVALLSPPYSTLSYYHAPWIQPSSIQTGHRVAVPLGNIGLRAGIILECIKYTTTIPDNTQEFDDQLSHKVRINIENQELDLKPIFWPLEKTPLLSKNYLQMIKELANRQMLNPGQVLTGILPLALRSTKIKLRVYTESYPETYSLNELSRFNQNKLTLLGKAWEQGQVDIQENLSQAIEKDVCRICLDPPWPIRPNAKKQLAVLDYLWDFGDCSRKQLLDFFGKNVQITLQELVKKEYISIGGNWSVKEEKINDPQNNQNTEEGYRKNFFYSSILLNKPKETAKHNFALTSKQEQIVNSLFADLLCCKNKKQSKTSLIHGVTGSGKTLIYLSLADKVLKLGYSAILLAPEVALAWKLKRESEFFFPTLPIFFAHGYLSPSLKEKTFKNLAVRQEPCILIGTRSALFLPLDNIGLIVLDEEHDSSFKQDQGFVYQAKEIAHFKAAQENSLLVLGSATPDIRTFHAAKQNYINLHTINSRLGAKSNYNILQKEQSEDVGTLPQLEFVDISQQQTSQGILAKESLKTIKDSLEKGEQAVILLNRRGYAPLMYCLDCGIIARCPNCDISLTFHKSREKLLCHYCCYNTFFPVHCTKCHNTNFLPLGEGTEKLEENLNSILPAGIKVLRLDKDTTKRVGRMEEILASFAKQEAQILVGTQMLSKGHHFPNVTTAIIADADLGLNLPDYRAAEKTFQLLVQAAGRAGRGEKKGKVIIQTRDINNFYWKFIKNLDYIGFFEQEIAKRKIRNYPPFTKLALIKLSLPINYEQKDYIINRFSQLARGHAKNLNLTVLGPAPAPLAILKGRIRQHCLVKSENWQAIRLLYSLIKTELNKYKQIRLTLDIDPINML